MNSENHEESLSGRLFSTTYEKRALQAYRRFFSIQDIEESHVVQLAFGVLLLAFFYSFSRWFYSAAISISSYTDNTYTCWPYFQDCGRWYFLTMLPHGYTQSIFYMGLFAILLLIAFLMYRKEWAVAHAVFLIPFVCKVIIIFVLSQQLASNFDYYDVLLSVVLLFLPYKLFFLRLTFVLFYFLSSTIKIHDGWILGTYFTSLQTGLPIFGNALAPLFTNLVIGMQIVGAWLLLSRNNVLQRTALVYFIIFHLYSGIFVGYRYPTSALLMLIVLFAIATRETRVPVPRTRRALAGWYFVALLFIAQFTAIAIPGDQKMSLEGNYYGFFMFEANHQCISTVQYYFNDGTTRMSRVESFDASQRCDPYEYWFALHTQCMRNPDLQAIAWQFDHSINGGPYYRIVDVANTCDLSYMPFSHNDWIKLPGSESVPIVGYPRKDFFQ